MKKIFIKNNLIRKTAFTLAEVLITLAIIGVVSAIVIPSVLKNYNDKKYNTARLKALKTFGEAGRLASINDEMNSQANAKDFVNNVLSKYLKITKVCDTAEECGFPSEIQPSNPSAGKLNSNNLKTWKQIGVSSTYMESPINNTNMSIYIEATDGFVAKIFYNPICGRNSHEITYGDICTFKECQSYAVDQVCMNLIYDMNGTKGPNHVGEDIGLVTTFWSGLNAVSVSPGILQYNEAKFIYDMGNYSWQDAQNLCISKGIQKKQYSLPNIYEMQSIAMNKVLSSLPSGHFWSSSPVVDRTGMSWHVHNISHRYHTSQIAGGNVWCVRR